MPSSRGASQPRAQNPTSCMAGRFYTIWATREAPRHTHNNIFKIVSYDMQGFPGDSVVKNLLANAGNAGLIPGLGRSPGEGNGNPLQHSCLENPRDRGAWWATVHGAAKVGHNNISYIPQRKRLGECTAKDPGWWDYVYLWLRLVWHFL